MFRTANLCQSVSYFLLVIIVSVITLWLLITSVSFYSTGKLVVFLENTEFEEDCQFVAIDNDIPMGTGSIPKLVEVTDNVVYSKPVPTKLDIIRETLGFGNDPVPLVCQMLGLSHMEETDSHSELLDKHVTSQYKQIKDQEESDDWRPLINEGKFSQITGCSLYSIHFIKSFHFKI